MNRVELPHDKARYGPLRAAVEGRPELVRVAALINAFATAEDRALPEAANIVLDRLAGLELFELRTAGDAQLLGPRRAFNIVWPGGEPGVAPADHVEPEKNLRRGPAGALVAMRHHWGCADSAERSWDEDECAPLAIVRADAVAMFPEVFRPAEKVQAPAPATNDQDQEKPAWRPGQQKLSTIEIQRRWNALRDELVRDGKNPDRATGLLASEFKVHRSTIQRAVQGIKQKPSYWPTPLVSVKPS